MPDWSIKIVPSTSQIAGATAEFIPDLDDARPGDTLVAQENDLISWNNTTGQPCQPWPTDAAGNPLPDSQVSTAIGNYLSDEIPPGRSSSPAYVVVMQTSGSPPIDKPLITYCCKKNPRIRGAIEVTRIPSLGS